MGDKNVSVVLLTDFPCCLFAFSSTWLGVCHAAFCQVVASLSMYFHVHTNIITFSEGTGLLTFSFFSRIFFWMQRAPIFF